MAPADLLAGRGDDSDPLVAVLAERGTRAVMPARRKRQHPRACDTTRHAQRPPVERLFSRLQQFRCVAPRYDKRAALFLAFLQLAATVRWLRDC